MSELFLISDTHFGHKNVLTFEHEGRPLRPFETLTEMHIQMVERWNSVVQPNDKVYHLGDVAFTKEGLDILHMLNGKKRLVRGNHDGFKLNAYTRHFQEVHGVRQIDGYWLTHVPMHPCSMYRAKGNIHGHLHADVVKHEPKRLDLLAEPDGRYFNVSVERIDYTPISFDVVKEAIQCAC